MQEKEVAAEPPTVEGPTEPAPIAEEEEEEEEGGLYQQPCSRIKVKIYA